MVSSFYLSLLLKSKRRDEMFETRFLIISLNLVRRSVLEMLLPRFIEAEIFTLYWKRRQSEHGSYDCHEQCYRERR